MFLSLEAKEDVEMFFISAPAFIDNQGFRGIECRSGEEGDRQNKCLIRTISFLLSVWTGFKHLAYE
jgi:hypothetical protein